MQWYLSWTFNLPHQTTSLLKAKLNAVSAAQTFTKGFLCFHVILWVVTSFSALSTNLTHPAYSWVWCVMWTQAENWAQSFCSESCLKQKSSKVLNIPRCCLRGHALLGHTKLRLHSLGHTAVSGVPDTDWMEPWLTPESVFFLPIPMIPYVNLSWTFNCTVQLATQARVGKKRADGWQGEINED